VVALALIVSLSAAMAGCAAGPPDGPRNRIGALPFPGTFTLYRSVDPQDLGLHRFERTPRLFQRDEAESGIIYTTRAGFLDVAHLRVTIDTTRFCARQVRSAILAHRDHVDLPTPDGSTFRITLHREVLGRDPDDALIEELSIRVGQRLAYLMMTWHELITWFGYRLVVFIDDSASAFTYDDTMSHVIGIDVAGRALRDTESPSFDEAVTDALLVELSALGAVSPAQTDEAAHAVEGWWWSHGRPLKRQLDVGFSEGAVRPWLVRGLSFAPDFEEPESFPLPTLTDVLGRDCSNICPVRITPGIPEARRMRELLPGRPRTLSAEVDLPLLVEATRQDMRRRLAADVDDPVPPLPRPSFVATSAAPRRSARHVSLGR
jgi:hypothetical protein